jgi:thiosulfate/3-mercaptopyruvate sulfurtransferase
MPWMINAAQLDKFRKNQKNVIILDASWYLPEENIDAEATFIKQHIPGARFLDLNLLSDKTAPSPNMTTVDERVINDTLGQLGINNDSKIIIYDNCKHYSSCRAIWLFKFFGHNPNQLYLLDGDINAWINYGGKVESDEPKPGTTKAYEATLQFKYLRTLDQIKANLIHPTEQIVDMRHPVRYAGGPEPRPQLRSGHIPGSFSFPFMTFFTDNHCWKPLEKIRKQLQSIGINLTFPIISTCGSGMTAAILNMALDLLGHDNHSLYNGSWCEWGAKTLYANEQSLNERPVVTSLEN